MLNVLGCRLTYYGQAETNAWAWFSIALRPRKPWGSLERTAQDGHLDSHTAPELCKVEYDDDCFYIALFSALEQTHCARMWFYMKWLAFYSAFLNVHRSGVLTALAWLVPHETAAVSAQVLCTPYNRTPCHFMQSHIRKVYACLGVTCHLHFWQNDRDLLRATAVTRGWNGYRNKSLHRKLTLEKKILPPLLQGFEPATFQSRVRRSNHWAIPLPKVEYLLTARLSLLPPFLRQFE